MDLNILQQISAECELCNLCRGRNKPVFARGDPKAEAVVCGMCPGPEENMAGSPFVGAAGKILDEILLRSFGEPTYITNLVKCFVTPGTELRTEWMYSCLPYFIVQLELVKPKVIIALGKDVCNFLLNNDLKIGQMRGKVYDYMGIKLVSTYHPSYLARGGGTSHKHFNRVVDDFRIATNYM